MKKAELSLNFIFLIFIATIASMVIIGLITSWSFDINRYIRGWLDDDDPEQILDNQKVNITRCDRADSEIIKHARLCFEKAREGMVRGELCYGIIMPSGGCSVDSAAIRTELDSKGVNSLTHLEGTVHKVIITYDYDDYRVEIS